MSSQFSNDVTLLENMLHSNHTSRRAITGKGHDLSNPINICQQLCLANSVAHDNINNNGNPGKAKDKTRPDAIIKAAKENQKLCDDNVKLK